MSTKQTLQLSNISVIESIFAKRSINSEQHFPRQNMKYFAVWDPAKNILLRDNRNISFEDIVYHMEKGELLDVIAHHNPAKYPTQRILIVAIEAYAYLVPFVQSGTEVTLKTIYPNRKATRKYLRSLAKVAV